MKLKDYVIIGLMLVIVGMGTLLLQQKHTQNNTTPSELVQQPDEKGKKFQSPYEAKQVRNTLTKHSSELQPCYLDYLAKKPKITEGKVEVDWYVQTNGTTEKAQVISSDFEDQSVGECIVKLLSAWEFPPPPGNQKVYLSHVFFFKDINKPDSNKPVFENINPKK